MTIIRSIDDIKHAFYINLEHRVDRKEQVEEQLKTIGINAERFNAIKMENGAIGCSMSHLKILQDALANKLDHVLIVEDDILFLKPEVFKPQINKFFELHGNNWDVVLLAGNNMPPYKPIDDTCIQVSRCQTTTGYLVNGHYIKVLMQNVKLGLTNLISKPSEHSKFAIDKFWFVLQGASKWFLITPLTVVQREGYSDIEKRVISYDTIMQDIDKASLFDAIKQQNALRQQDAVKQQNALSKMGLNFFK
jgi:glycosyl transferase family 25